MKTPTPEEMRLAMRPMVEVIADAMREQLRLVMSLLTEDELEALKKLHEAPPISPHDVRLAVALCQRILTCRKPGEAADGGHSPS